MRPWTEKEIRLLGAKADADIGRLIGRPGKAVWAKRQALGIAAPPPLVRCWTPQQDKVVLAQPLAEAARLLERTIVAVKIRRARLFKRLNPSHSSKSLSLEQVERRIHVPRYESKNVEEKVRFIAGPYQPPFVPNGGWLKCKVRGQLQVGGYTNALIPWPTAVGHSKQLIICGDLLRALKTESRLAVAYHFGVSRGLVSEWRHRLGIERLNPGSMRLFWRNVNLARTDEARAKMSRQREGRKDLMSPQDRERLRKLQRRPKTEQWKRRMSRHWRRRCSLTGRPPKWTPEQLKLIGTRPDREVARIINRSLLAIKAKKFQLLKLKRLSHCP